jgi:hypothetical protein
VSRSLLEATGVVPVRPLSPQPAPKEAEPVLLAEGVEVEVPVVPQVDQLAPELLPDHTGSAISGLYDKEYQEEWEAYWLAFVAVAVPPLYGRWDAAAFSLAENPEDSATSRRSAPEDVGTNHPSAN